MNQVRVYYSPDYVQAATESDTTRKARWVADRLAELPVPGVELVAPVPLTPAELGTVHAPAYVRSIEIGEPSDLARSNGIGWDADLFQAVAASNGGAVAAALHVLTTKQNAGSLSSGLHHARRDRGAGFCTFNGLALAARAAQRAGAGRIEERERLVFDWARTRAIPVAFVLAGGYATGTDERRRLVDLHRATIAAAAVGA